MESRQSKNHGLVAEIVPGIALDDLLASGLGGGISVVDSGENESVEEEHQSDVTHQPPDEDVGSGGSVVLSEDFLSLSIINDNVESLGCVGWSVAPGDIVKIAH